MRAGRWKIAGLMVGLLSLVAAACGDDDGDAGGFAPERGTTEADERGTTDDGGGDADREAYVEAIAEAVDLEDYPGADESTRRCLGELFVDVAGVDRIAAEYTPEEIRNDPDWELEGDPTPEEAQELARGLGECVDVRTMFVESAADDATWGFAAECLAGQFTDDMMAAMVAAEMVEDASTVLAPEADGIAEVMVDCMEFRDMLRQEWEQDPTVGPAAADCLAEQLTDDMLVRLMKAEILGQPDQALQQEMETAFAPCEALAP